MNKLFALIFFIAISNSIFSQTKAQIDTVYDQQGRKFPLKNLMVNVENRYGQGAVIASTNSCSSGYFNVFFANNSGFVGSGTLIAQRQAILCQVLSDISGMVNPTFTSSTTKVNILCDDINLYVTNSNTAATLGIFSPFVAFPIGIQNSNPGIMDNLIYKTITTQQDPYNGLAVPTQTVYNLNNAMFYHGMIAMNFNNSNYSYNSDSSVLPNWWEYDMYTILLHEMMHALGFASYIGPNGTSLYGVANNYYSRYDLFLKDYTGNNLITTSNNCSSLYGHAFTSNTLNLQPNCTNTFVQNNTSCNTANYYSSPNIPKVPVFTPDCFVFGSSLSHFEDQCFPLTGPPYGNDAAFVISNAVAPGVYKRFLQEEERLVLCDLGYSVTSTYTSTANSASKTYTAGNCFNTFVGGINDGVTISNNVVTYNINTTLFTPVTVTNILGNDINATNYKCLETVIGTGTISNTTGPGNFTYTPGNSGIHLLRYVPINANGKEGSITYIYIKVPIPSATCPAVVADPCNLIYNGDLELYSTLPLATNTSSVVFPCGWAGASTGTADYFHGLSPMPNSVGVPCNEFGYEPDNVPGNKAYLGMYTIPGQVPYVEPIYTQLTSALQPLTAYTLRFDVSLSEGFSNVSLPLQAYFATSNAFINNSNGSGINSVPGSILLTTSMSFTQTTGWTQVTMNFVTGATANQQYLALGNLFNVPVTGITSAPLNLNSCFYWSNSMFGGTTAYHFIDNIKLTATAYNATLNLPSTVCSNQTVNLSASANPSGGVFTGNGVVCTGANCVFNASLVPTGITNLTYSYSTVSAPCPYLGSGSIDVLPPVPFTLNKLNSVCYTWQTTTLTASSTQTSGMSYTWQPGNLTGATVTVSPLATTIYTVTAYNGTCSSTKTITVLIPTISFINPPTSLCTVYQTYFLNSYLAPGTPTTNGIWVATNPTFTQSSIGLWIATNSQVYAQQGTLPGTYTLSYYYTGSNGCQLSSSFTINVLLTPTLTTSGPLVQCTNIPGYSSTLNVVSTSSLPMTYTWTPGNIVSPTLAISPSATTIYSVVGTDGTCTSRPALAEVRMSSVCCGSGTSTTAWKYITTGSISNATLNGLYAINQNLIITGTVSMYGEYYMAPNVSIIVNGGYLNTDAVVSTPDGTVISKAHLRSCGNMWNGISITNWGRVKFDNPDLIEDANVAISSNNSINNLFWPYDYEIQLDKVTFNRNRIGVSIKNYTQTTNNMASFYVTNCIFTCRNFTYVPLTSSLFPIWPSYGNFSGAVTPTNALASPYPMANYTPANLKAPYASDPAYAGVYIENSGITSNPTSTNTTYKSITIGDANSANALPNIFDNLYTGINALNSNVISSANVFQNSRNYVVNVTTNYGAGIKAENNWLNSNNYHSMLRTEGLVNASTNINRFYDCYSGIEAKNIFQINVKYNEFRSTQYSTATVIGGPGFYGMNIQSNIFKDYSIHGNKFLNVRIGVTLQAQYGLYKFNSIAQSGQVWGSVNIGYNLFSPAASQGGTIGNGFMYAGVWANNFLFSRTPLQTNTITPFTGLKIQNNTFDRPYRGVQVANFNDGSFNKLTSNNTFTIIQEPGGQSAQFGINYENNNFGTVNSNTISGFTSNPTTTLSGIRFSMNKNSYTECNNLTNLPKGTEFSSSNLAMKWKGNTMQFCGRGMQLSNNAVIGTQGTVTVPSDNYWAGSWAVDFNTWTDQTSNAVSSKIYRRTLAGYNPLNNSGAPINNSYFVNTNLLPANNSASWPTCVPVLSPTKGGYPPKTQLAQAIAANTLTYGGNYTSETAEIYKILLFEDLFEDNDLTSSDASIQTFYNNNLAGNIGKIVQIGQLLSEGDIVTATSSLSTFTESNTIQANYKKFYNLYIKDFTESPKLTSQDSLDLNELAHKCPFIDGPVVYYARALNQKVKKEVEGYNDNACDNNGQMFLEYEGEEEFRKIQPSINSENAPQIYELFPNPASDQLFISSPFKEGSLEVIIRDVTNKIIMQVRLQVTDFKAALKFDLLNGIYFVSLIRPNENLITKKIVVSK